MPKVDRRLRLAAGAMAAVGAAALGTGVAAAAAPVAGSVSGPVTWVSGQMFKLKTSLSPTGSSTVHVGTSAVITEQAAGTRADLKKGVCVTAIGPKNGKGVVTASRLMLSQPVKGQCGAGFGGGGPRPGGAPGQRPPGSASGGGNGGNGTGGGPSGGFASFGFATGAITAVKGSTLTLHGRQGSASVAVAAKAQLTKTVHVGVSAIKVKLCAFVRGTSSDKGVTVAAQDVALSQPGTGGCNPRFRRP